jgi:DNA-binding MarR family transcriptional regulator
MPTDSFIDKFKEWMEISMHRSQWNFIQYARKKNLSLSHLGALFHLQRMGQSGVTELGEHLDVTSAAASQMLDRLVQQGLIHRTEDPQDRRVKQIVLSDKGNRILEEGMQARQRWLKELANSLSKEERELVIASLEVLIDKMKTQKNAEMHKYGQHR